MEGVIVKKEPVESEQDEEEDVYEVERIIEMRVEEGEVLYRVRWKGYCSDDDTWEPEAHLEDCREVLLAFKKAATDAKKEAEAKKVVQKPLPTKSDLFEADSESDSDKDRLSEAPVKKKKKKKVREEEDELQPRKEKKKKKKKDKWRDEFKPVPAPETDEEETEPPSPPEPKEKQAEQKKRLIDSDDEDDELAPPKKPKKDKTKDGGKHRKDRGEEGKKKKAKKERKIESSEDEGPAGLIEDDRSEGLSDAQLDEDVQAETSAKPPEKTRMEDKAKHKKGKLDVKLQGIKELILDRKSKKGDFSLKESSLHKLKSLTSRGREEAAPHSSDSSDSSSLHKKAKSKSQEGTSAAAKTPSSTSTSSLATAGKHKEDEAAKEDSSGHKEAKSSTHLFETYLLDCEAKDRAPRRPPAHTPASDKSSNKAPKILGKVEKVSKPIKEPPSLKELEKTEFKTKPLEVVSKPSQGYGFSLDSDEREAQESATKPRPGDDSRERRERLEESQRLSWERKGPADDRKKRREDGEPKLHGGSDSHMSSQDPLETTDKSDRGPAALSLGMDLNLDWMTLDDFQKHLNGEDEILSAPLLSPSELRDAVKSGDYMAVKLALNSKEQYNLDQEAYTNGEKRSLEEQSPKDYFSPQCLNFPQTGEKTLSSCASTNSRTHKDIQKDASDSGKTAFNSDLNHKSQGNKMLQDTEAVLPSKLRPTVNIPNLTIDVENILVKHLDKTKGNKASYTGENANKGVTGQPHCTAQVSCEAGSQDRTRRLGHSRKTSETKQPTRTSQRACRKVVRSPEPSTDEEDVKKEPCIKHFCLYCKMPFIQLAKHLEKKHADETDVAHAIHFPKGSRVRESLLDQIRSNGDYEHNTKGLTNPGKEDGSQKELSPKICVRDFLPCQHCYTFYRKTDLWRHERSCKARKGDEMSSGIPKQGDTNASTTSQLLPMSEFLTEGCKEIIHIMHQDDIARHIKNDPLICKYGNALSAKYDHDKSQFAYIGQKMRELGRFMLAVKELDNSVQYLHELCHPSRFELAVEGAKKASGFDPTSTKFKTCSLVSKIGYSLKRAAEIAFGESRMTENSQTESEVKQFIQLVDTKWNHCFSQKSLSVSLKQEGRKVEVNTSSVTEDLIKLHRFITNEEDEARKELKESPSVANWKKLSEATLADVCLFNRARVGNIGRLLLLTYTSKKFCGKFVPSADQIKKCTKLEVELGEHFTRLELEGQYGRNMLVLLTEKMSLSLDLLVENRQNAGVMESNPYLFARTEGPSFIRALDCFRRATVECGVKNPEALLSPSLRERIANCWQLMSLSEPELDGVAKLLKKSSQECYKLAKNATQLEEASKQLLQLERIQIPVSANPLSIGTPSKATLKRRPWSEREQAAVKHNMSEFFGKMKVPGKKDCNACIAAEPDLSGRSWTDIKNYVHNSIQTIRRRSNQHKDEMNSKDVNPKTGVSEVQTNTRTDLEDLAVGCIMSSGLQEHLRESSNCCMTMVPHTNLTEPTHYTQDMPLTYTSLCPASSDMVHTSQPLMSSFTALNATDTQVVPTFTPLSTTNALMSPVYTSDLNSIHPMAASYSQNSLSIPQSPMYAPQDHLNVPMLPSFSPHSVLGTSMLPTYTPLNSPSPPMVPAFSSPLNDRNSMMVSSFTPLNNSSTSSYPTSPPRTSMTAQVVPTVHGAGIPDRLPLVPESPSVTTLRKQVPPSAKPQKRIKRLWSGEEQAAVRRQFGDFCNLVKVPGKKDCDACLAAEPALSSRTWREVKYYVHNSIQSIKRRGHTAVQKQTEGPKQPLEIPVSNPEWDGPVYLSL
ncbi:M-phase phosphoprotein 8 isoform X2 [Nerophis ophidion]|uniref:M-phase phosphoprotein 8 isoform X2 n=1 Tax=Nerophis ophidion TaxID=159077 RepID=UPI002AE08E29|nr:M-phase phosphoprotein 8 isoform X2 [Nerophis ophidion]